jgi:uncharacterized protein YjeT (DUF2065 family)
LGLRDLVVAVGLVLALEGMLYALAPGGMKRMVALLLEQPESSIRWTGLITAIAGVAIVWFARGI